MKQQLGVDVSGSYVFNPAAHTITLTVTNYSLTLAKILLITNVTANTVIYNFADVNRGAVSFTNNVLTLDYNTAAMNANDVLQIYLDLPAIDESLQAYLRRLLQVLQSNAVTDSAQRQRVILDGGTTAITNTTGLGPNVASNTSTNPYAASNVPSQGINEGPIDQRWRVVEAARTNYAVAIRPNLLF